MADQSTLDRRAALARRAQLKAQAQAKAGGFTPPAPAPEATGEIPQKDLYESDLNRTASSFADQAGIKKLLAQRGYTDVAYDPDGNLIAKGPDGRWFRDKDNFFGHPVNWSEARLGHALPELGMAGALLTTPLDAAPTGGLSLLALAAKAAAGRMAGESLRRATGRSMGVYDSDIADASLAAEGLEGATGGLTAPLGALKLPIGKGVRASINEMTDTALQNAWKKAGQYAARTQAVLAGVPRESVEVIYKNPRAAERAMAPDFVPNTMLPATRKELATNSRAKKNALRAARKEFITKHGDEILPTGAEQTRVMDFLDDHSPNAQGLSGISEKERAEIRALRNGAFIQPATAQTPPSMRVTHVVPGEPKVVAPPVVASEIELYQPHWDQLTPRPREQFRPTGKQIEVVPAKTVPTLEKIELQAGVPGRDLLKTRDHLTTRVDSFDKPELAGSTSGPAQAYYRSARRGVTDVIHEADPNLTAMDAEYSAFAKEAALAAPVMKRGRGESFLENLHWGPRSEQEAAVAAVAPKAFDELINPYAAVRAFDESSAGRGWLTKRQALRYGTGAVGVAQAPQNPMVAAIAAGASLAQTPALQRSIAINGAKYLAPAMRKAYEAAVLKNSKLLTPVLGAQAAEPVAQGAQSAWSLLRGTSEETE